METQVSEGEIIMSYWEDPLFRKIYRKIQRRKYRKKLNINILQQALTEYYQTQDSVKLVSGKYTPTPTNNLNRNVTTEKVEEEPPEDPIISVCGTSMLNSKWQELKQIQREAGTAPTATPDERLRRYLLSHFKDDK